MLKILALEGGGILAINFLIGLRKLSVEFDKQKKDLLDYFDVYSGVSSGAIIAAAFAVREKVLSHLLKIDESLMNEILFMSRVPKCKFQEWKKRIREHKQKCSTLIINLLIYIFRNKSQDIFELNDPSNQLPIIGTKYTNKKYYLFKKYIDFNMKDIPNKRILVVKTFNLKELKIDIFSNYQNLGSKYSRNIADIVDWSSNAPTYFPNNGVHVDGGNFINSSFLTEKQIFTGKDLIFFSIGSKFSKINLPLNEEYKWFQNLVNVFYNLGKQIDKITNDKYFHLSFDFKNYHLDDFQLLPEICQNAENIDISNAIQFIHNHII